jgi:hypothetical protein
LITENIQKRALWFEAIMFAFNGERSMTDKPNNPSYSSGSNKAYTRTVTDRETTLKKKFVFFIFEGRGEG